LALAICVHSCRNLVDEYIEQTKKQFSFTQIVSSSPKFQVYYNERTRAQKDRVDFALEHCRRRDIWLQMDVLRYSLASHFKVVHNLCGREDFPFLSVFPFCFRDLGMTSTEDSHLGLTRCWERVRGARL